MANGFLSLPRDFRYENCNRTESRIGILFRREIFAIERRLLWSDAVGLQVSRNGEMKTGDLLAMGQTFVKECLGVLGQGEPIATHSLGSFGLFCDVVFGVVVGVVV